jgi:hypothetical protein
MMKKILGKSWKTSLAGYAGCAGYAALTVVTGGGWALKDIALAAGVAIIGRLAKDSGVTGDEK